MYEGPTTVVRGNEVGALVDDPEGADDVLVLVVPVLMAAEGDWSSSSPLQPAVTATTTPQATATRASLCRPSTGLDMARGYR